ncbi:Nif3-like dinuclear metal center hexameric protein [Ureibacillus chungkukjangi]|uniref:Nif3-like dinuclear metal center hexameric protein n=1 Tax=Ureibacillus chungkukjangi TaxID=1202712 RepID=UPI0020413463|nr:Nif3-like dinuclear metal center hexameric protein [Ureibacillus chungkukjangi]MCM3387957.1 Nif3-like dinuclear metal center hexameric protein [Ureibacillus chungkukjangi]
MKNANGHEIIQLFESWSPKKLACMDNDPIGLAIGTLNKEVTKVLVTLDVNDKVADEAIAKGCQLIIAHHPPIFRKLSNLRTDTPAGKLYEKLIKNDIAVYAAHTNLDVADGGVNDLLAEALLLENIEILEKTYHENLMKLALFVPDEYAEKVRHALAKAGAGSIGNYDSCSFSTNGQGRFRALEGANPFIGDIGEMEKTDEEKIEVVFIQSIKNKVLKAMLNAHPYEEPAYDLYTLAVETNEMGLGRVGKLKEPMTLESFAEHVKSQLDVPRVRVVGDTSTLISKVAVVGGDGNKYIHTAKRSGADVFVTGDIGFHIAQDAESIGLNIVDPGHHVEKVMIKGVAEKMDGLCSQAKLSVEFVQTEIDTEPFIFL